MDMFVASTIILATWGALGPLVGVRYGQTLARRWQKEHFVREGKRQEYREVLRALSTALAPIIQSEMERGDNETKAGIVAENACHEVLESCIFIAAELKTMNVKSGDEIRGRRNPGTDGTFTSLWHTPLSRGLTASSLAAKTRTNTHP